MKPITRISAAVMLLSLLLTGCASAAENSISGELQIDASVEADKEMQEYVDEAFELLKAHGNESENIWPGYTLPKNAIIVCQRDDATNKVIHAWKLTTTEKVELTNEQLAGVEIPAAGTYVCFFTRKIP